MYCSINSRTKATDRFHDLGSALVPHEFQELAAPMAPMQLTDGSASGHVQRGKIKAMKYGAQRRALGKFERRKARIWARVEHLFRVITRQSGLLKVRFRALAKNTAYSVTLFALSNLWMATKILLV